MRRNYSNTAVATTLAVGISDSDTSLTVADATGYPDPPFTITIESEVILVGAKDGTTFSALTRGYDGTTAAAHDSGAAVEHAVVAEDVRRTWGSGLFHLGFTVGSRLTTVPVSVSRRNWAIEQNMIKATPLLVQEAFRLVDISVKVATAGSADGTIKVMLYAHDYSLGRPSPQTLIDVLTSNLPSDTTGLKTVVVNRVLAPGVYWIGFLATGFTTAPVFVVDGGNSYNAMVPMMTDKGIEDGRAGLRLAKQGGTTTESDFNVAIATGDVPLVWITTEAV